MTAWDESFALDMQRRISRHQPVSDEDADRFAAMVTAAVDTANAQRAGTEPERHPWTDQEAHDVYTRINRDPGSVTDQEADDFATWAAEQTSRPERGIVPPVPGPDASIEERHAYIDAATRSGQEPDAATVAAFEVQVQQALRDHNAAMEARFPPGFFDDGRPRAPESEQAMREQLHDLYTRQQQDPASVDAADWHRVTGQLGAMVDEHNADQRRRALPWVLDTPADPGVEPGAVEAMTAPAPWTPRQPTETEQALADLDQLDQEAADLDGDAA